MPNNEIRDFYLFVDLVKSEAEFSEEDLDQVQKLLVSAARDCVPQDRNSFVEFQSNTGVEVTKSWLILNLNEGIRLHLCCYLYELNFPVIGITYFILFHRIRHNYNPIGSLEELKSIQCRKFLFLKQSHPLPSVMFTLKFHIASTELFKKI